jgi:ATP-dependent Clp protease ATP-binding subunit ClpC
MFERFTDRSRRVMDLAQAEARLLRHYHIGPGHLLIGLVGERRSVAARALASLGITGEAARRRVEAITGLGEGAPPGHLAITPRAVEALERAGHWAGELGHRHVGPEHILLGLVGEDDGAAEPVLRGLGTDGETVRREVLELMLSDTEDRINVEALQWRYSRAGGGPDPDELDLQVTQARREKEAAIEAQDFDRAVAARDRERLLLDEQAARAQRRAGPAGTPSLSEQAERLRDLLRRDEP